MTSRKDEGMISVSSAFGSVAAAACILAAGLSAASHGQFGTTGRIKTAPAAKKKAPRPAAPRPRPSPAPDKAVRVELAFWETIKDSKDPKDFRAYLEKYPEGNFAALARNRLDSLGGSTVGTKTQRSCPTISVSCPDTAWSGESVTFTANVSEGNPSVIPTLNWTVSAGTISSGQGTSSITVDTGGVLHGTAITATVDVGGYSRDCATSTSCTVDARKPVVPRIKKTGDDDFPEMVSKTTRAAAPAAKASPAEQGRCPAAVDAPQGVTSPARIISKPEPAYSEEARKNQVSGVVTLSAVLCRTGEVTDIKVLNGLPNGLTERAVAAARRIKFEPARKGGEAVSVRKVIVYSFSLY